MVQIRSNTVNFEVFWFLVIFAISSIDLEVDTHPVRDYPELSQSAGLSLIRVNWSNYPDYPIGLSYRIIPDYPGLSPNWPKLPQIDPKTTKLTKFTVFWKTVVWNFRKMKIEIKRSQYLNRDIFINQILYRYCYTHR